MTNKILAPPRNLQVKGLREALAEDLEISVHEAGDEFYQWVQTQPPEKHQQLLEQYIHNNASKLPEDDQERIYSLPRREAIDALKIALKAMVEAEEKLKQMQAQRDQEWRDRQAKEGKQLETNMAKNDESFDSDKMLGTADVSTGGSDLDLDELENMEDLMS